MKRMKESGVSPKKLSLCRGRVLTQAKKKLKSTQRQERPGRPVMLSLLWCDRSQILETLIISERLSLEKSTKVE